MNNPLALWDNKFRDARDYVHLVPNGIKWPRDNRKRCDTSVRTANVTMTGKYEYRTTVTHY